MAESDQLGVARAQNRFGAGDVETSSRNDRPLEHLAQHARCHRRLIGIDCLDALHSRLDGVQVGQPERVEPARRVEKSDLQIGIGNGALSPARRQPYADAVRTPHFNQGLHDLEQETRALFDAAAVSIGAMVR